MPERLPWWRNEAWVPGITGLLWIFVASGEGPVPVLMHACVGSLMLVSGGANLLFEGDARARHIGAAGSLLGILVGLLSFLWLPLAGTFALVALSVASAIAVGRLAIQAEESHEDVPDPGAGVRTALEASLDSAILGQMMTFAPAHALIGDGRRVTEEVHDALALFRDRGWSEKPASYHQTPPPLEDPAIRRRRVRGVDFEHLRFESGYAPHPDEPGRERYLGYAPCRTAHAWVLRHRGAERPWLLCINGYQMGTPLVDFGAFRPEWLHHRLGMNLAIGVLPMHGPRRIRRVSGDGFLAGDLLDTVHGFAQTAWDLRRLLSWVRAQGATRVGVHGLSLGGYSTALLASLADDLACAIPGIPATDFARLSWRHGPQRELRRAEELGLGLGETRELKRVVSPLALTPKVPVERRYIYGGSSDLLVPPDQVRDLWRHWERPKICWYPGAHVTFGFHPQVRRFVQDALRESELAV